MNHGNKKIAALVLGIAGVGLVIALAVHAPQAQANALSDFFGNLFKFKPLEGIQSLTPASPVPPQAANAPLYKPVLDYEQAVVAAVEKARPAGVSITISKNLPVIEQCPYNPFGDLPPEFQQFFGNDGQGFTQPCATGKTHLEQVGSGSGFIVSSDGLILTNKHVVADAGASYTVITSDGKKYDAKVLARDPLQDLAVVKINATGLTAVTLGDSDTLALGQTAIAIGNALGEFPNTVSVGVVSGLSRTVTASGPGGSGQETIQGVIQTDAAINPGNSGGPLLNLRGEVVGINTAVASGAQGIGFAMPINRAKHDIASVKATGEIRTPYLGVRYLTITPDIAKAQKLPVDEGALVRGNDQGPAIQLDSPAAKAGVQAEDIITKVNDRALDGDHALGDLIANFNVGDVVALTLNRGGKTVTLQVTLGNRPAGQ